MFPDLGQGPAPSEIEHNAGIGRAQVAALAHISALVLPEREGEVVTYVAVPKIADGRGPADLDVVAQVVAGQAEQLIQVSAVIDYGHYLVIAERIVFIHAGADEHARHQGFMVVGHGPVKTGHAIDLPAASVRDVERSDPVYVNGEARNRGSAAADCRAEG